MFAAARKLALITLLILSASCAGKLGRLSGEELPEELPAEFREKFKVDGAGEKEKPKAATKGANAKQKAKKKRRFVWRRARHGGIESIWLQERHVFEVTYFGIHAGTFTIDVLPFKKINGRKVYHIRGRAVSSKLFNLFYRLDDMVETYLDYEGLFSHRFHMTLDETKQTRNSLELYDSEKKQTFYWNRWNHHKKGYVEKKQFYPMPAFPQDSLSALYYLRMVPLRARSVVKFPVVSEGNNFVAVVKVVRREYLQTPLGRMRTVVVKPETQYKGKLKKSGDSFIWLTDDDRRWVIRLEAKVKIGSVVAALKSVQMGKRPEKTTPIKAAANGLSR